MQHARTHLSSLFLCSCPWRSLSLSLSVGAALRDRHSLPRLHSASSASQEQHAAAPLCVHASRPPIEQPRTVRGSGWRSSSKQPWPPLLLCSARGKNHRAVVETARHPVGRTICTTLLTTMTIYSSNGDDVSLLLRPTPPLVMPFPIRKFCFGHKKLTLPF
jgi:hypothetical protein